MFVKLLLRSKLIVLDLIHFRCIFFGNVQREWKRYILFGIGGNGNFLHYHFLFNNRLVIICRGWERFKNTVSLYEIINLSVAYNFVIHSHKLFKSMRKNLNQKIDKCKQTEPSMLSERASTEFMMSSLWLLSTVFSVSLPLSATFSTVLSVDLF